MKFTNREKTAKMKYFALYECLHCYNSKKLSERREKGTSRGFAVYTRLWVQGHPMSSKVINIDEYRKLTCDILYQ